MPRKKDQEVCEHFTWLLCLHRGTWYADGRNNSRNVGKHSLGVDDRGEAIRAVRDLDGRIALTQSRPPSTSSVASDEKVTLGTPQTYRAGAEVAKHWTQ